MSEALRQIRATILGIAIGCGLYRLAVGGDWGFQIGGLCGASICYLSVWWVNRAALSLEGERE
jgi:hypothetical protein